MTMVDVSIGIGAWSFSARKAFEVVPNIGDYISVDGDEVYPVTHRTVCPKIVYITCNHHFTSEDEAKEAGRAWGAR